MLIPQYRKFSKRDIILGASGKPIINCFCGDNYPNGWIIKEQEEAIILLSQKFGFEFDMLTNESKVVRFNEDIRNWNVVRLKKFHQLMLAIYGLLQIEYLEV